MLCVPLVPAVPVVVSPEPVVVPDPDMVPEPCPAVVPLPPVPVDCAIATEPMSKVEATAIAMLFLFIAFSMVKAKLTRRACELIPGLLTCDKEKAGWGTMRRTEPHTVGNLPLIQ